MLRVHARQVETLWDELLPVEARALPEDLAQLDALLADPDLLAPFRARFAAEMETHAADPFSRGRPTISMATYLRRFCLIPLSAEVPDESTVRKLTRRLGPGHGRPHPRAERQGTAGAPLPAPRPARRLHGGRGRHPLPDRRRARRRRGAAAHAGCPARGSGGRGRTGRCSWRCHEPRRIRTRRRRGGSSSGRCSVA